MKKHILTLIIILIFDYSYSQQNLVPNPGFESNSGCPQSCGFNFLSNWINPTGFTPDYLNTCVTNSNCGIPFNHYGNQTALNGNGYVGIITGRPNEPSPGLREYIQVMLTSTLYAGSIYSVVVHVSIADSVKYIANSVGCYFSATAVSSTNIYTLPYFAQINFTTLNHNSSKTNWITLSGSFVAQGGENYMTIGNFSDDNTTVLDSFPTVGNYLGGYSYLYLDSISVTQLTTGFMENSGEYFFTCNPTIANDHVIISSSKEIKNIKVISILGTVISELQVNVKKTILDVSTLNNGIYYLQVEFDKEIQQKKRLIINR